MAEARKEGRKERRKRQQFFPRRKRGIEVTERQRIYNENIRVLLQQRAKVKMTVARYGKIF
jgi:hypothetical protein